MKQQYKVGRVRRAKGAVLAETAAVMILIVVATVLLTLFIINVGVVMLYKQKLSYAATQSADFAASLLSWQYCFLQTKNYSTRETRDRLNTLLKKSGLPPVKKENFSLIDDGTMVTISFKIDDLQIPGGPIFPTKISMQESGTADLTRGEPPALLNLFPQSKPGLGLMVPVYAAKMKLRPSAKNAARFTISIPGGSFSKK